MRLAEEAKLRNQMSAKRAKAEAERKHQVISDLWFFQYNSEFIALLLYRNVISVKHFIVENVKHQLVLNELVEPL